MLPYQVLIESKGLKKAELPTEVKAKIKKIEATLRAVGSFGKKDENGDYIITNNVRTKLDSLDADIVSGIWDYLENKQKQELRNDANTGTTTQYTQKTEVKVPQASTPTQVEPQEKVVEQTSKGNIGFFEF
tara:strand:- start:49 stop:441 length:393 start_codon:yes stop_codon:yes gene_type:complete